MVKINLRILDIEDVELKGKEKVPFIFTRIFVLVSYKKKDESSLMRRAIVDTGAIVSLLPISIWKQLDIEFVGYHTIKGIVKRESCSVPVKIGFVKIKILDELGNETKEFRTLVYCADSNDVPVILGLKDVLDRFKVEINIKQKEGYLIEL